MAGHSKFKNIQHRKGAQDQKRAKIFTKLVREIITAVKTGQPDQHHNPRLRTAIAAARASNLPKDRIDRAVASAGEVDNHDNYDQIRYEGFAPGGVALIIEALTDNKNRTASDVRAAFSKFGGNLAETGSVNFMFQHIGIIHYRADIAPAELIMDVAALSGANDIESTDFGHFMSVKVENFFACQEFLISHLGNPEQSCIKWQPQAVITITDQEQAEKLLKLIELLEESDDVQRVFSNHQLSDQLSQKLWH